MHIKTHFGRLLVQDQFRFRVSHLYFVSKPISNIFNLNKKITLLQAHIYSELL